MLLFAGDPHGDFRPINKVAAAQNPDAVILLGDYDLAAPLEEELDSWATRVDLGWIQGNHDADRDYWYDRLYSSELASACIDARVATLGNYRIAGLGGVFRSKIWHPETGIKYRTRMEYLSTLAPNKRWRGGIPLKHRASIWWEDYEKLFDQRADILVTHEAPSTHRHGFRELDDLAEAMGAKLIVHGHHHEDYEAELPSGTKVLGVGLAGVKDETGQLYAPGHYSNGRRPR